MCTHGSPSTMVSFSERFFFCRRPWTDTVDINWSWRKLESVCCSKLPFVAFLVSLRTWTSFWFSSTLIKNFTRKTGWCYDLYSTYFAHWELTWTAQYISLLACWLSQLWVLHLNVWCNDNIFSAMDVLECLVVSCGFLRSPRLTTCCVLLLLLFILFFF